MEASLWTREFTDTITKMPARCFLEGREVFYGISFFKFHARKATFAVTYASSKYLGPDHKFLRGILARLFSGAENLIFMAVVPAKKRGRKNVYKEKAINNPVCKRLRKGTNAPVQKYTV